MKSEECNHMGPFVDPSFIDDGRKYERLQNKYVDLKELEPRYFPVIALTRAAHRDNFLQLFHISRWTNEQIDQELQKLENKVLPHYLAERQAAEAKKQAEEKATAERTKGSDFDIDTN